MQVFRVEERNIKILNLLNEEVSLQEICTALKITRFNLANHLKTLIKYKYLIKSARAHYELTPKALRLILPNPPAHTSQLNIKTKRLHALGLRYQLKDKLSPAFKALQLAYILEVPVKHIGLHNNEQAMFKLGVTMRLTSRSLILYAPELYYLRGQPSIAVEARAKELLDREALRLEQKLQEYARFKLIRISIGVSTNALLSEVVSEEVADEGHPMAEASSISMESKIVLARHPFDRKERLVIDSSKKRAKNVKELECVRAESAGEDTDIVDAQFNAILDKELDLLQEQQERLRNTESIHKLKKAAIQQDERLMEIKELSVRLSNIIMSQQQEPASSKPRQQVWT